MLYLFFRGDPSPRRAGRDQDFPTAIIAQNGSPDAASAEPREATGFETRAIWNSLSESMDWSKKFGSAEGFLYNFSFFPPCLSQSGSADERSFEAQPRPAQPAHCECLRGRRGRGRHRRSLRRLDAALGARRGARRARGGGREPARAGRARRASSHPNTRATSSARSSPNIWWSSESAPTSAARRRTA